MKRAYPSFASFYRSVACQGKLCINTHFSNWRSVLDSELGVLKEPKSSLLQTIPDIFEMVHRVTLMPSGHPFEVQEGNIDRRASVLQHSDLEVATREEGEAAHRRKHARDALQVLKIS